MFPIDISRQNTLKKSALTVSSVATHENSPVYANEWTSWKKRQGYEGYCYTNGG